MGGYLVTGVGCGMGVYIVVVWGNMGVGGVL